MGISLSAETQKLIEDGMKETGAASADEFLRLALETLHERHGDDVEDLDADTRVAIEEGMAQADAGETRPWDEVKAELQAKFVR